MYVTCFSLFCHIAIHFYFSVRFWVSSFYLDLVSVVCVQLGPKFLKENGLKHVTFSTADGALEAAPAVRISSLM